ncbi:MAG: helix-hairpin-helix domain-containing protein [Oscillospiraceae bacterium]|nr:helix-hairpin-helix domain-containing protein [Oscillospiraceae bacterium]
MSELLKERILVVLALLLCVAVSLLAASEAPDLSPVGIIYSDTGVDTTRSQTGKAGVKSKSITHSSVMSPRSSVPNKININTATQDQLETLPGIGQVIAAQIIEYREANGKFDSIEEIMNVNNIGEKRFADIRDIICVD